MNNWIVFLIDGTKTTVKAPDKVGAAANAVRRIRRFMQITNTKRETRILRIEQE